MNSTSSPLSFGQANIAFNDSLRSLSASLSIEQVFSGILETISTVLGATLGLLYIEDDRILIGVNPSKAGSLEPVWAKGFVLIAETGIAMSSPALVPSMALSLDKPQQLSESVQAQVVSKIDPSIPVPPNHVVVCLDSRRTILCRGILLLAIPFGNRDLLPTLLRPSARYLEQVLPVMESVFRRQLQEILGTLIESGSRVFGREPRRQFQEIFSETCKQMGVEGASFFAKGISSASGEVQLVATTPRPVPSDRAAYPQYPTDTVSPTNVVLGIGKSCIIPEVNFFRKAMPSQWKMRAQDSPIWCDILDETKPRSLAFAFYRTYEDILYLFRCTNSERNPQVIFTLLDRIRAEKVVAALSLLHRATENEYRAMNIFNDVSHELRQRLMGILSASSFVRESLESRNYAPRTELERLKKLGHIRSTVHNMVSMLQRFAYPAPSLPEKEEPARGFLPYGELVRPVCEMFRVAARRRGIVFNYINANELGLIFANLNEWQQVIENLVSNAVKYTFDNEEVAVRFDRTDEGGGRIHFSSRSIEIKPDEVELIFRLRYRTPSAIEMTADGQGIGLAIATSIVNRYGARLSHSSKAQLNTFTVHIPKYLFEEMADFTKVSERLA